MRPVAGPVNPETRRNGNSFFLRSTAASMPRAAARGLHLAGRGRCTGREHSSYTYTYYIQWWLTFRSAPFRSEVRIRHLEPLHPATDVHVYVLCIEVRHRTSIFIIAYV